MPTATLRIISSDLPAPTPPHSTQEIAMALAHLADQDSISHLDLMDTLRALLHRTRANEDELRVLRDAQSAQCARICQLEAQLQMPNPRYRLAAQAALSRRSPDSARASNRRISSHD